MTTTTTMALLATAMLAACCADPAPRAARPVALDVAALAQRSLSAGSLPQMQLLASPDGRDLLAHIVACALPRGASITAITRDGTPYSFVGRLGLAPAWARHAPTRREHHRVAACVQVQTIGLTQA